jgi:hypothetical protein
MLRGTNKELGRLGDAKLLINIFLSDSLNQVILQSSLEEGGRNGIFASQASGDLENGGGFQVEKLPCRQLGEGLFFSFTSGHLEGGFDASQEVEWCAFGHGELEG